MNSCINPNLPEFKKLEKAYGRRLAERLVLGYNKNEVKIPSDELYYPTRKQINNWLTRDKLKITDNITALLAGNPEVNADVLISMLKGVIHKFEGNYFITRGDVKSDTRSNKTAARELVFPKNLQVMEELNSRFPNIFQLERKSGEADVVVKINPVKTLEEQELTKDRAGDLFTFERVKYSNDPQNARAKKSRIIAEALGKKFQKAFGMDYNIISREDAITILENSQTPYNNQTAFFYNETVYFIEGQFNYYNVMHEFSHPLMKGIAKNNKKLFNNLYTQLASTATGKNIIEYVKMQYPNLQEGSDRFKEEALVVALEVDSTQKINETLEDDVSFKNFITNLLYAIKQVLRTLTKEVNLKTLSSSTTLEELSDMMLNDDFEILEMGLDPSDFAEFNEQEIKDLSSYKSEQDKLLDELKNTDAQSLIDAINRTYTEAVFQINTLDKTPERLAAELRGKDGVAILRSLRDYLKKYETTNLDTSNIDMEDVLKAVSEQQLDFRERGIALIESINEIDVFTKRIQKILKDMDKTGKHMNTAGFSKVQYYIQFLTRQLEYVSDIQEGLGLDESNKLVQKLNGIDFVVKDSLKLTKKLQFEFISDFMSDQSSIMNTEVTNKMKEQVTTILKQDNFTDSEIQEFIKDVINNPNPRVFGYESTSLPRLPKTHKYITKEIMNYYAKRLVQSDIEDFLKGQKGDIGFGAALLVPYANIDDPIGAFVRYTKAQLATAEQKSLRKSNEIANELAPHLKAVGYNPNLTGQLGKMMLFIDKVPTKNEKGEFEEFEVYSVLNRFKFWRLDKGILEDNLEKARDKKDIDAIAKAGKELNEFHEKFMHRKYINDVYEVQKIWTRDNEVLNPITGKNIIVSAKVSTEAYSERQTLLNRLNTFSSSPFTEEDDLVEIPESEVLRMEYEELYNVYNPDGTPKQGEDLEKVLIRQIYRDRSSKFREFITNTDRVQKDFDHYVRVTLAAKGISPEEAPAPGETENRYQKELAKFIKKNFRSAYTPEFWAEKNRIVSELVDISNKYPNPVSQDLADLFKQRNVFVKLITDKNGHTNAMRLTPVQIKKVKEIEEKIVKLSENFDKQSGLSREDLMKLEGYDNRILTTQGNPQFTAAETDDYNRLTSVKNTLGMDPFIFQKQKQLIKDLMGLRAIEPTEYYFNAFNTALANVEVGEINLENADEWINDPERLLAAKAQSTTFAEWFDKNHYTRTSTMKDGTKTTKYYRLKVWNIELPINPEHYQTTLLTDPITKQEIKIPGLPVGKYSYSRIKNEYRTGYNSNTGKVDLKVGTEIDNKGNFLPRANAQDRKYINEEYEQLEREGGARFKLIEAYTKVMLEIQENKPKASKLYLDLPRIRPTSTLEYAQSGKAKEDFIEKSKGIIGAVKAEFTKAKDDQERGFNANVDAMLITTDLQGEPITSIPVRGLYKLNKNEVSQDMLKSLASYMYSLDAQQALMEAEPIAQALSNVLNDPKNAIKNLNKASKNIKKSTKITQFLIEKNNRRSEALDYFIDKVYYGQAQNQFAEEHPMITKIATSLMGSAHRAFAAIDIPSALKNKWGMTFQAFVETAGGKYINAKSQALGRVWSYRTMVYLTSRGIYEKGPKSLEVQLMERFDPITGKTRTDFGKSTSRTFIKDLIDSTWMYDARKFMEVQEGLTLFSAMMYNKYIDQTQPDGTVKQIRYIDAFELDSEKQIQLKKGVDPEYNFEPVKYTLAAGETIDEIATRYNTTVDNLIKLNKVKSKEAFEEGDNIIISGNSKFIDFRLKIQGLGKKLNGMTDETDNAQANKYLGVRLFTFYRKFAIPMFLNRFQMDTSKENFGGEVYDWDLNDTTRGYYITGLVAMKDLVLDLKNKWPIMKKEEKIAIKKMLAEGFYLAVLALAVTFIFGYDPGDEDRFEKMRKREEDYGKLGWAANHMLYQLMMIRKENESFIPLPGIGLNEWLEFTDSTSIVTGPTLDLYSKMLMDIIYLVTGSEKAYYKQEVGPYQWQQEESWKFWNHFGSAFGVKGKSKEPIWAIRKAEQFENLK